MGEAAIFAFGGLVFPAWTFLEAQETRGMVRESASRNPNLPPESMSGCSKQQDGRVSGDSEEVVSPVHSFQGQISLHFPKTGILE